MNPARTSVVVRLGKWPKVIGGVRSWRGIKFDEFKSCRMQLSSAKR